MKKDKELIEEIVNRLKTPRELPYREGAWERFKTIEGASARTPVTRMWPRIASVAACLFIASFVGYIMLKKEIKDNVSKEKINQVVSTLEEAKKNGGLGQQREELENLQIEDVVPHSESQLVAVKAQVKPVDEILPELVSADIKFDPSLLLASKLSHTIGKAEVQYGIHGSPVSKESSSANTDKLLTELASINRGLASTALTHSTVEKNIAPKSFKYGDRFTLGLFVAPNSTSDNLKVGAGLTVAYNINKRISIRTGASYNTYEVGVLKDPLSPASVETVNAPISYSDMSSGLLSISNGQMSKVAIPNVNAVSGFVESVEIPLEMKYNVGKSFYATAGVSYSTIINQERNAQYIDNIDANTFKNGFPATEKEAAQAMKVVTKTVKSSDKNVSTNGYNGFVNLSVGKKVNVTSKFGVSVEPYFKIPVGEFRRSDMNYNNGGVRIMTTF